MLIRRLLLRSVLVIAACGNIHPKKTVPSIPEKSMQELGRVRL